jgi:tetratricopeptide (TPR) repeat protein
MRLPQPSPDRARRSLPAAAETVPPSSAATPKRKRITYYLALLAAWVIIPITLIVLIEVGLRAADYGYTTRFLVEKHNDLGDYHTLNMSFYKQFLYMEKESVGMEPFDVVVPPKSPETYRVLVLGGSAALGWYFADYGYWRYLETMLRAACPDKRIEFVCAAWFGMNSHVMRHIAEHADVLKPDLVLVYLGNNEMTGPFGLLTRAGREDITPAELDRHIRMHLAVSEMRLMQLLGGPARNITFSLAGGKKWGFDAPLNSLNDPRLLRVYDHYERNLQAICESATRSGAQVVLSTVARNQRDWKPRVSVHPQEWTEAKDAVWKPLMDRGTAALESGDHGAALAAFKEAVALDDNYAMAHFRLGQAALGSGDTALAKEAFAKAWTTDHTLDSATPSINAAVERVALEWQGKGVHFVDAFEAMSATSPHGLLGHEWLYDHIHLTQPGSHELARVFFEAIRPHLPETMHCDTAAAPLSFEACQQWLGASPQVYASNLRRAVTSIESMWPDHDSTWYAAQADVVAPDTGAPDFQAIIQGYREATGLNPDDFEVRYRLIRLFLDTGLPHDELRENTQELARRHPYHWRTLLVQAQAEAAVGNWEGALAQAQNLIDNYPEHPESYLQQGLLLERAEKFDAAFEAYHQSASMRPMADMPLSFETRLLIKLGRMEEAREVAEVALKNNPNNDGCYDQLDEILHELITREERIEYWTRLAEKYPEPGHAARMLTKAQGEQ